MSKAVNFFFPLLLIRTHPVMTSKNQMVFSPRKIASGRATRGVPVTHLSQPVLSSQVSTLLDTVQDLKHQVHKRNLLLENAKMNCKKRFIPTLERQLTALQTPSQASNPRSPTDWYFLGASSHFNGSENHAVDDVEIVDQSDNEDDIEDAVLLALAVYSVIIMEKGKNNPSRTSIHKCFINF
jgi:hypothetical protein